MSKDLVFVRCLLVLAAAFQVGVQRTAYARDSQEAASRYSRRQWTAEDGFRIGQVSAITQTPDGYLWIGGEKGLASFDGQSFQASRATGEASITHVLGLATDAQGGLWVWMQGENLLHYRLGTFANVANEVGLSGGNLTALSRGVDGTVLMSTLGQQVLEYKSGRVTQIAWTNIPNTLMLAIAKTSDGRVWAGTRDYGLAYMEGGRIISIGAKDAPKKINCLLAGRGNTLLVGTDEGVFLWNGSRMVRLAEMAALDRAVVLTMVRDRDGNLWCGTTNGLFRVSTAIGSQAAVEVYLPKQNVTALFEDREGDLWIGTARNIQCWKDTAFQSYGSGNDRQLGIPGPIYVDERGVGWVGSADGGLYRVDHGRADKSKPGVFGRDVIYSLAGRNGDLWAGRQSGGVTHVFGAEHKFASETFSTSDGLAQNSVFSVFEAQDGTLWAGTLSAGLSRFEDGRWRTFTTADGLPSNTVSVIEEGAGPDLWIGTPNGLASLNKGRWRTFDDHDGLPSNDVSSLLADRDAVGKPVLWIGTAQGLVSMQSGVIQRIHSGAAILREPIWGLAKDRAGFLWVSTPNGLARVSRERLLEGDIDSTEIRLYGRSDGLEEAVGVKRTRSMVSDKYGNIWVSTAGGLAVTTPAYMRHRAARTIVHIESIVADGTAISLTSPKISEPQRRIAFNYNGLNFSAPERIRFRYRLDGFDKDWSEPVPTRQAVYTHLDPGSYRFRVIASDGEGGWSSSESSSGFTIEPATWQTWWFRSACLLAAVILCWCAYLVRVRQTAIQNSLIFEERLAERMRIAQDLHDTLLQSFHALMLRFQAVSNMLPERPSHAKELLDTAIDRAADALTESRDAVQKLRSRPTGSSDLAEVLTRVGHELVEAHSGAAAVPTFRVLVEGVTRAINPMVRDDLYRIGREAIGNAFRHAQADQIEVELSYEGRILCLRVRDDGIGIDPHLLAHGGRDGHWGLSGMRERAKTLGGQLTVWSELYQGTEIELRMPGGLAYCVEGQQSSEHQGEVTIDNDA